MSKKVHPVVARSTFRSQHVKSTTCSDHFWKLRCWKSARRCGAKHITKSKCTKQAMFGPLLEVAMSKKCTPLWRKAHFEVNINTTCSDHFWKLRCWKSARRCGAKHISKSKCTKHTRFGPLLQVQMSFRVAGARGCAHGQKWAMCEGFVAFSTTTTTTPHYTPIHHTTATATPSLHSTTLRYTPPHSTTLRHTTLNYTQLHYTTLHYTALHYTTPHHTTLHYDTLHPTPLHSSPLHYTTLHYTTLRYTTPHYTTPRHTTPHYTQLHTHWHYTTLHCTTLPYTTLQVQLHLQLQLQLQLHYTTFTLRYTTRHYTIKITLHYTTVHYTTLHYTTLHHTTPHSIILH